MPARTVKIRQDEQTRAKIQAGNIITRLTKFIDGQIEMAPHQVTAALGLLRKCVPDLSSVEHSGEVATTYVVRAPAPLAQPEAWQQQHTPRLN